MDYSKYRVLFIDSHIITVNNIIWGLLELGFDVERSQKRVSLMDESDEEIEYLKKELSSFDFAVTQNFSASVARACYEKGIPYISWVYDSPQVSLYHSNAMFDTNYIFAFDKTQVKRIRETGCSRIFYQPLAANMMATSAIEITDDDIKKYQADVSFVGQIYNQDKYHEIMKAAPENVINEIDSLYKNVASKWDKNISPLGFLPDEAIDYFRNYVVNDHSDKITMDEKYIAELVYIIPTLAGYERVEMLNRCGSICNTRFYTKSPEALLSGIKNVSIMPPVDAESEVYKVYYASKINLNITLRSIETGIPQRVFDIMSVGGPVFTNYQEEAEELFVPDKDIVIYHSLDELEDKIRYYLSHDDARVRIGINGYMRVRDEYNYAVSLSKMFSIVREN